MQANGYSVIKKYTQEEIDELVNEKYYLKYYSNEEMDYKRLLVDDASWCVGKGHSARHYE